MSPLVVDAPDGTRHAVGATGGPRIPAILLSAVVDIVVYGATLTEAIAAPHLSVRPTDGALQGEAVLLESLGRPGLPIGPGDFGAATGVTVQPAGGLVAGLDPRFDAAAAAP
jgi:gamma-glutamyltranspeptidase